MRVMNKKGVNVVMNAVIHIVFALVIYFLFARFVMGYNGGAALYEDYYAKQISLVINKAEPGSEVRLDVAKISEIAVSRGKNVNNIIKIDNVNNRVIVSLREGGGTAYEFFNDVDIVDWKVEQLAGEGGVNQFKFRVVEKQREDVSR